VEALKANDQAFNSTDHQKHIENYLAFSASLYIDPNRGIEEKESPKVKKENTGYQYPVWPVGAYHPDNRQGKARSRPETEIKHCLTRLVLIEERPQLSVIEQQDYPQDNE
jgi:hypothetical protein